MSSDHNASYLVDSGVREASYTIDKELKFLRRPTSGTDQLTWSLEFMVQAVPQSLDGRDLDVSDDWAPWEFPSVAKTIHQRVVDGIASDANARTVAEQMQQFTVLQRLFRNALDGYLGTEVPLQKLVDLQRATAASVRMQPQPRWNIQQPGFDTLDELNRGFTDELQAYVASGSVTGACKQRIVNVLAKEQAAPWPRQSHVWDFVSDVESYCEFGDISSGVIGLRDRLREQDLIEAAIGYSRSLGPDDKQRAPFQCEPL